ncbi:MAG: hypothetical protein GF311_26650 [Candidatus Lokiarchaeota archaeon]|nr:hypothetical protein [Candidatus Lokiarchaeota archaeon]
MNKKILFISAFTLIFFTNVILAQAWLTSYVLYDSEGDLRRFSGKLFDNFDLTYDNEDLRDELDNLTIQFRNNWYNEELSSPLAVSDKEDFACIDILQIALEDTSKNETKFSVITNGDLSQVDSWTLYIWNHPEDSADEMILAISGSNDKYTLTDISNDETYKDSNFLEVSNTLEIQDFKTEYWNSENLEFASIVPVDPDDPESDVVVDVYPDAFNTWLFIMALIIVILIIIAALFIYLYYSKGGTL